MSAEPAVSLTSPSLSVYPALPICLFPTSHSLSLPPLFLSASLCPTPTSISPVLSPPLSPVSPRPPPITFSPLSLFESFSPSLFSALPFSASTLYPPVLFWFSPSLPPLPPPFLHLRPGFNPMWEETLVFTLHMAELALVRFLVWDHDPIGQDFIGQRTLAFNSMLPGSGTNRTLPRKASKSLHVSAFVSKKTRSRSSDDL